MRTCKEEATKYLPKILEHLDVAKSEKELKVETGLPALVVRMTIMYARNHGMIREIFTPSPRNTRVNLVKYERPTQSL